MASLDLATLRITIEADAEGVKAQLDEVSSAVQEMNSKVDDSGKQVKSIADQMDYFGTMIMTKVTNTVVDCFKTCVASAADFTETLGKTEVVFGDMTDKVMDWSETSIDSMGIAQSTALEMASLYGDMATGMGLASESATDMSMNMTQLAADLASFKNLSIDQAGNALKGIFTGEGEALKSLGVIMNETTLSAFALEQGLTKPFNKMTQTEKVMLRYQYVIKATASAQGDFARTGDSLSNRQKKLQESIKQLGTSFGSILAPAVSSAVAVIQNIVTFIDGLDPTIKTIILTIAGFVAALGPVILAIGMVQKAATIAAAALTTMQLAAWQFVAIAAAVTAAIAGVVALSSALNSSKTTVDKSSESYNNLVSSIQAADDETIEDKTVNVDVTLPDEQQQQAIAKFKNLIGELKDKKVGVDVETNGLSDEEIERIKSLYETLYDEYVNVDVAIKLPPEVDQQHFAELKELVEGWDIEGKDFDIAPTFTLPDMSDEDFKGYQRNIVQAAIDTKGFADAVKDAKTALGDLADAQKQAIAAQALTEVNRLAALFNQGLISEEVYLQQGTTILETAKAEIDAISTDTATQQKALQILTDGSTANDIPFVLQELAEGADRATISIEDTKAAMAELVDTENSGGDFENLETTGAIAFAGIVNDTNTALDGLIAAGATYEATVAEINANAEKAPEMLDQASRLDDMAKAYDTISGMLQGGTWDWTGMEDFIADTDKLGVAVQGTSLTVEDLQKSLQTLTIDNGVDFGNTRFTAYPTFSAYSDAFTSDADTLKTDAAAVSDTTAALSDAAATLKSDIAAVNEQLGYTPESLDAALTLVEKSGADMPVATKKAVESVVTLVDDMATAAASGEPAANLAETISKLNQSDITYAEGFQNGKNLIDGMIIGANGDRLNEHIKRVVRQALLGARVEMQINSPSRKFRDLVGKPMAQGIEVGFTGYAPNILSSVKKSINKIMGGAQELSFGGIVNKVAASTNINYDAIQNAMSNAVSEMKLAFNVDGRTLARSTSEDNARESALRGRSLAMGLGRW